MSRSSQARLTRCDTLESTFGTAPSAAHTIIPRTGGSGSADRQFEASNRVRSDLKTDDVIRLNESGALTIEDEWYYEAHEEEIADAMGSAWSTPLAIDGVAGDISAVASGNQITSTTTDKFIDVALGQAIRTFGFSNADNNAVLRVSAKPDNETLTVTGSTLINETPAGTDAKIRGSYVREGTTKRLVSLEEFYKDLTDEYWAYLGAMCRSFGFSFTHPGRMECSFEYLTKAPLHATSSVSNGTINADPSEGNRAMSSADAWGSVLEGGSALTPKVRSFSLALARGVTHEDGAGTLGPTDAGYDSFDFSGSLEVRNSAAGATLADKVANNTASTLEFQTTDPAGNVYHFYMPNLIYNGDGAPSAGGRDSDVFISLPFMLARDTTLDFMFQITKLAATA